MDFFHIIIKLLINKYNKLYIDYKYRNAENCFLSNNNQKCALKIKRNVL